MPRTMRPFTDHVYPDDEGNAMPYDSPAAPQLLERTGDGGPSWPTRLTNDVGIELQPFQARAFVTLVGLATPAGPRKLLSANPARGALTLWCLSAGANTDGFRAAANAYDATRDESSIIIPAALIGGPSLRFAWSQEVWVQQRSAGAGITLCAMTEDWAR